MLRHTFDVSFASRIKTISHNLDSYLVVKQIYHALDGLLNRNINLNHTFNGRLLRSREHTFDVLLIGFIWHHTVDVYLKGEAASELPSGVPSISRNLIDNSFPSVAGLQNQLVTFPLIADYSSLDFWGYGLEDSFASFEISPDPWGTVFNSRLASIGAILYNKGDS